MTEYDRHRHWEKDTKDMQGYGVCVKVYVSNEVLPYSTMLISVFYVGLFHKCLFFFAILQTKLIFVV